VVKASKKPTLDDFKALVETLRTLDFVVEDRSMHEYGNECANLSWVCSLDVEVAYRNGLGGTLYKTL
jgi:hypothetical protein